MNKLIRVCMFGMLGVLAVLPVYAQDNDKIQLATQIVELQLGNNVKDKAGETLAGMVTPMVVRDNPGQEQQIAAIAVQTIKPAMDAGADNITKQTADSLAQSFSKEELEQIIAFQSSPLGVKYRKFSSDSGQKMRDIAKNETENQAQNGVRAFVVQLRKAGLRVPKELDH